MGIISSANNVPCTPLGTSLAVTKTKRGKHVKFLPPGSYWRVKQAIANAQAEVGGPVMAADILVSLRDVTYFWSKIPVILALQDLWREDEILADSHGNRWSLVPQEGYETFSDRYERKFMADYKLDTNLKLMPNENLQINFDWL